MKKVVIFIAALFAALVVWSSPATAATYPEVAWQLRNVTCDPYPDCTWGPATQSEIVDEATIVLTKPAATTGTSFESTDLGLEVSEGAELIVSYSTNSLDNLSSGAVRLFYYNAPDSDTTLDAPTDKACAGMSDCTTGVVDGSTSGTMSITIPAGTTIGTVGLTYDASNTTTGTVTFTNMKLGEEDILFIKPEVPPTATPPVSPTPSTPVPSPTDDLVDPVSNNKPGLPQTGTSAPIYAGVAAGLLGLGTGLILLTRKRRASN